MRPGSLVWIECPSDGGSAPLFHLPPKHTPTCACQRDYLARVNLPNAHRETLGMLQRGQVGRGQFLGPSFQIFQTATPVSRQASKIAQVVGVQLASPLVFFQRIQTSILDQPLRQLASDVATPYRSVLHRVQVEGHLGDQGNASLAVGLLLSDALEPIHLPHALQYSP